jgi:hypothetical protein
MRTRLTICLKVFKLLAFRRRLVVEIEKNPLMRKLCLCTGKLSYSEPHPDGTLSSAYEECSEEKRETEENLSGKEEINSTFKAITDLQKPYLIICIIKSGSDCAYPGDHTCLDISPKHISYHTKETSSLLTLNHQKGISIQVRIQRNSSSSILSSSK